MSAGGSGGVRLIGHAAIEYAESHGLLLCKYADPTEGVREDVSPSEAREIAAQDPSLVYLGAPTPTERGTTTYHVTRRSQGGLFGHSTDCCDESGCSGYEMYLGTTTTYPDAEAGDVIDDVGETA